MQQPSLPQICDFADLPGLWQQWRDAGATALTVLLGQPVAHSISPAMHQAGFAAAGLPHVYIACAVAPAELPTALQLLARLGAVGCNVTIPHKEAALSLAATASPIAVGVGASNCLVLGDGQWHAENTDVTGLVAALRYDHGLNVQDKHGIVLGTGGFARAAVAALQLAGCARVTVLGRRPEAVADVVDALQQAKLSQGSEVTGLALGTAAAEAALATASICINATPVGMWPDVADTPVDPASLAADCFVYDSIYNPRVTRLLREAMQRGLPAADGLSLLVRQGADSWPHWFGMAAPVAVLQRAAEAALAEG